MNRMILVVVSLFFITFSFAQRTKFAIEPSVKNKFKFENLEILSNDFPDYYTWDSAKMICENFGEGWRLPNREELNILFLNRSKIGGFLKNTKYWSSELYSKNGRVAYEQLFNFQGFKDVSPTYSKYKVRAVRNLHN
jgi:hypothetical protein